MKRRNQKPDHRNHDRAPALIRGAQDQKTKLLLSDLRTWQWVCDAGRSCSHRLGPTAYDLPLARGGQIPFHWTSRRRAVTCAAARTIRRTQTTRDMNFGWTNWINSTETSLMPRWSRRLLLPANIGNALGLSPQPPATAGGWSLNYGSRVVLVVNRPLPQAVLTKPSWLSRSQHPHLSKLAGNVRTPRLIVTAPLRS